MTAVRRRPCPWLWRRRIMARDVCPLDGADRGGMNTASVLYGDDDDDDDPRHYPERAFASPEGTVTKVVRERVSGRWRLVHATGTTLRYRRDWGQNLG